MPGSGSGSAPVPKMMGGARRHRKTARKSRKARKSVRRTRKH